MHVIPLAGWLLRVRPYAGGLFAIGCGWLTRVRLEGRPLHNPPRIALDAGFVCSGIGLLTPDLIKFQEKSCRGRPLRLPASLGIELVYEAALYGGGLPRRPAVTHKQRQPGGSMPAGCFLYSKSEN